MHKTIVNPDDTLSGQIEPSTERVFDEASGCWKSVPKAPEPVKAEKTKKKKKESK